MLNLTKMIVNDNEFLADLMYVGSMTKDTRTQKQKFEDAAKEADTDNDETVFDKKLRKIAKSPKVESSFVTNTPVKSPIVKVGRVGGHRGRGGRGG